MAAMAMLLKVLVVCLALLSLSLGAFQPGCSFSGNQCVYNVQLGHEGQCDTPQVVGGTSGQTGSGSCCEIVQGNMNNLQGIVEVLTNQMKQVQSHLGLTQSTANLLNSTTNERDKLIQDLRLMEAELNTSQSNLADLVKKSADVIKALKEELANATRDLNNCKGVLGLKTTNTVPLVTATGDYAQTTCTFENGTCGFVNDVGNTAKWVMGSSSLSTYTGPREDHTYGSPSGHYMYLKPSEGAPYYSSRYRTARMTSSQFQPAHDYCIRFWYNMYGTDIRSLRVYAKIGSGLGYPVWNSSGNQGQTWQLADISLDSEYTGHPFYVVFEATTDASLYSPSNPRVVSGNDDIAIDDVYIYNISCQSLPSCPLGSKIRKENTSSSCYTFHTSPKTWYKSAQACREEGANSHLVSVNSKEEQDFLVNTINQNAGLKAAGSYGWFTSGNDERSESNFDWTDTGTPYTSKYSDWHPGQPNNVGNDQDCLLLQYGADNYEWGDIDCDEPHPYICEVNRPVV